MSPAADPDLARLGARRRSVPADALSAVLDPVVVLTATVLLVAGLASAGPLAALGWAALTLTFLVLLPWGLLHLLVRRGHLPDRHVVVRRDRHRVMWPAALSVAAGVLVLGLLGAPGPLLGLVVAVLLGAVVVSAVTVAWKASVHTAVLAAAGVVLAAHLGPRTWYAVAPLLLLLGWARWRAGRHTLAQTAGGALLGGACAAVVLATGGWGSGPVSP